MKNETSRRAVITGLSAVPLAGLITAVPAAASASANTAEWYSLKAEYEAAVGADERYFNEVFDPAWEACKAAVGPEPDLTYCAYGGTFDFRPQIHMLSTEADECAFPPREVQAELRRRWDAHMEKKRKLEEEYDLDELGRRTDELSAARTALEKRLLQMPAPDLPALLWKIDALWGRELIEEGATECAAYDADWVVPLIHDARRLLSEGRA